MLTAIDVQLRAIDVARWVGAQEIDDFGHLLREPEPAHGNVRNESLGAGRQNIGVDLARRDGVDRIPRGTKSAAISRVSEASAAFDVA